MVGKEPVPYHAASDGVSSKPAFGFPKVVAVPAILSSLWRREVCCFLLLSPGAGCGGSCVSLLNGSVSSGVQSPMSI